MRENVALTGYVLVVLLAALTIFAAAMGAV